MKIALVQQYTADYQPLADLTIANHWEYCQKYGYDYCVSREEIPYNPNFGFLRFPFILSLFKEYNYDYVHFSGIDTLIMNYNIKIEDWIDNKHDFFVAKETSGGYRALNADVFIVKNSEKGRGWLEFVYSKQAEYSNIIWREQKVMIDYVDKSPYNEFVKIVPMQSFNSYPWRFYDENQSGYATIHKDEPGDFKLGDFLLHAPGHTMANRLRIWAEFLPQVIK